MSFPFIADSTVGTMADMMHSNPAAYYAQTLRNLPVGLTYFIIHTAYDNEEMRSVTIGFTDWGSAWRQTEFDFFSSPECARLLKENNIQIISWREIRDKLYR